MGTGGTNGDEDDSYSLTLARAIHTNLKLRLANVRSEKGGRRTEAVLSGHVDGYREANPGANGIAGSAHQQRTHLLEEHPEVALAPFTSPPLDLHLTGGRKSMAVESELGGAKAVMVDLKKLVDRPFNEDKSLVTEANSPKGLDRFDAPLRAQSMRDGGIYHHHELFRRKGQPGSMAMVRTRTYIGGKVRYDSRVDDLHREVRGSILRSLERPDDPD